VPLGMMGGFAWMRRPAVRLRVFRGGEAAAVRMALTVWWKLAVRLGGIR
jgi:hypothetical protein